MTQLGWYVHYNKQDYNKFGIEPPSSKSKSGTVAWGMMGNRIFDPHSIKAAAVSRGVKSDDDQKLKDYEKFLNDLYRGKGNKTNNTEVYKYRNSIVQLLNDYCADLLKKVDGFIDWDTGKVYTRTANIGSHHFSKIGAMSEESLQSMAKQAENLVDALSKSTNINAINKYMEECETTLENFVKDINDGINAVKEAYESKSNSSLANWLQHARYKDSTSEKAQAQSRIFQLRDQFNHLLQLASVLPDGTEYITGQSAEIAVEKIASFYKATVEKLITENMSKEELKAVLGRDKSGVQHVGRNPLKVVFNLDGIVSIGKETFLKGDDNFKVGDNTGYIFVSKGQQKVDVEVGWKEKGKINDQWNLSVKSINLQNKSEIDLESSNMRSLIYHLQEDPVFGTHILNIMANHPDDDNVKLMVNENYLKANLYLKILYNAISGSGLMVSEKNIANVFILLDNSTGNVRVYRIEDLIDKAIKMIMSNVNNATKILRVGMKGNGDDLANQKLSEARFNNVFVNPTARTYDEKMMAAKRRILNLLNEIHKYKLEVSLKTSFFREIEKI